MLIKRTTQDDAPVLHRIAVDAYLQSHAKSAPPDVVDNYIREKLNEDVLREELLNASNIFHFIDHDGKTAGYSKIMFDTPHANIALSNVTKLERLYLLPEYYGLHLGDALLQYNIELAKNKQQYGLWLYVWKGNDRAVNFYKKKGFQVIGDHLFPVSPSLSVPNYLMLLNF